MHTQKNIKKLTVVICSVLLIASIVLCPVTVFAEDSYVSQSVEIQYNVPSTFTVEIPSYMQIDNSVQLSGTDFNIASGKCVTVAIGYSSFNDNNNIEMQLGGTSNYIEVGFYNDDTGNKATKTSPNIATFVEDDGSGNAATNYFHAEIVDGDSARAGQYSGTVTFVISTEYSSN